MKKADKRKLARELYEKLTALGIKMKVEGNWTKMDGGPIPTELLMQSGQCGDELAEVVREKSGRFMKRKTHPSGAFTLVELLVTIAIVAIIAAIAVPHVFGMTIKSDPPTSDSGVAKKSVVVQTDPSGWTVEQKNIADRLKMDNTPGSIKHLYVISPMSGQVIIYSTVKGKVTSGSKRLTPTKVVVGSSGEYKRGGFPAPDGTTTDEVLQDDGTYGSSTEYIYWWDVQGRYHQHFFTGGQIITVSDQPLPVRNVLINLEEAR